MTKFSGLPEDTNPTPDDYVATVDATSGTNKRVRFANLKSIFLIKGSEEQQELDNTAIVKRVVAITGGGSIVPNADTTDMLVVTAIDSDVTLGAPTGAPYDGQTIFIRMKATNTSSRAIAYNAIYRGINVTPPTTINAAQLIYMIIAYDEPESKWDILSVGRS